LYADAVYGGDNSLARIKLRQQGSSGLLQTKPQTARSRIDQQVIESVDSVTTRRYLA
jgi:hypothetical protein